MKILDRYIISKFFGTFFFVINIILLLAVVIDMSENIGELIESGAPIWDIISRYYFNFYFFYYNFLIHLLVFVSTIVFTSMLSSKSEIIAILSSGVSFNRFLRPYIWASALIVLSSLIFNHFLLPFSNSIGWDFKVEYINNKYKGDRKNFHLEYENNNYIYLGNYSYRNNKANYFKLERIENGTILREVTARTAIYDSLNKSWKLSDVLIRDYLAQEKEHLTQKANLDTTINFTPDEMSLRFEISANMTTPELMKYIEVEREKGNDQLVFFELELHKRTAFPFATFIMVIIAVSLSFRKKRGGIGMNIVLGISMAMIFEFINKFSSVAATNSGFSPFIASWIPNVIFGLIALFLLKKAQK